uniref:carboxy terminal-processing peptidase n=1 Tax=Pedobacter schmidteae TaxID=2201271 RepID=UPI000EAD0831|nr:carboxy terminal-processing peptidase [Pedobacter schmidteae]
MNKTNYSYALKCLAYSAALCLGPVQNLWAQVGQPDIAATQKATILNVVRNLEQKHVRPKAIDDNFSKIIWKKYLESLDPNKDVFLKSDFEELKKYELIIDDELHEGSSAFFTAAYQIYQKRLLSAAAGYKKILAKPFDFNKKETVQLNGSLLGYAGSQAELSRLWQKKAKYLVLQRLQDLDSVKEGGQTTEKEARMKVDKWLMGTFKNLTGPSALNERFSQYLNIVTLEVDPHTNYFAPVQTRNISNHMAKRFFGVGLELQEKDGDVFIKALRPGGMALKSGLVDVNDRILSISDPNGKMVDIAGKAIVEVADLIRGDQDTEVAMNLLKTNGQEKTVSLKRAEIKDEEGRARSAIMEKDGQKIGYLFLPEFYVDMVNPAGIRSADDVLQEILKLKAENVKGIIFDLRNNGGGSLDEVVKMTGYFLGAGPKVQIKGPNELKIHTTYNEALYNGPLVVMVNEQSASASEIFAAAIQDYKRGIIIGSPATYGKGSAQATLPMGKMGDKVKGVPNVSYGSLRLTQHHFYRVNGASTQLRGVRSDVVLPGKLAYLKVREMDNSTALQWDSIPALRYTESNQPGVWNKVLNLAREIAGKDNSFKNIDENSKLLAESQLNPVNLNRYEFKKQQEVLQEYTQKIEIGAKMTALKKIKVSAAPGYGEKTGNEWYLKWIEGLSTDLYIDKSLDIINGTMVKK